MGRVIAVKTEIGSVSLFMFKNLNWFERGAMWNFDQSEDSVGYYRAKPKTG
jgi:hypothetical protein